MATVAVTLSEKEGFLDGRAGDFEVAIDRGEVNAPRSIELVMLGLGACTVATVQHYMNRKGMPVSGLGVEVSAELDTATNAYGDFKISLSVGDRFTDAERQILLSIAKSCRIHKTLTSDLDIDIALRAPANEVGQSEESSA
jgi:putative redox protein